MCTLFKNYRNLFENVLENNLKRLCYEWLFSFLNIDDIYVMNVAYLDLLANWVTAKPKT